jgi:hypothetical protein
MGCDAGMEYTGKVRGTVTLDGKPVTSGTVVSLPLEGGRGAIGEILADGTFALHTDNHGENVIPGRHRLAVAASKSSDQQEPYNPEADFIFLLPLRYSDPGQSGFTVDVVAGEECVVDLSMTSK